MIILVVVILTKHHGHLLSIIQALSLFHFSHVLLKFLHGFVDLSVIEVVLDSTEHVCHSV
jgi:hypothetical protein